MDYRTVAWFFLTNLPANLAVLAGLVISLAMVRRHPSVSLLAGLAFLLSLANSLVGTFLSLTAPRLLARLGPNEFGRIMLLRGLAGSTVAAACTGLLIAAVFGWRQAAVPSSHLEQLERGGQ